MTAPREWICQRGEEHAEERRAAVRASGSGALREGLTFYHTSLHRGPGAAGIPGFARNALLFREVTTLAGDQGPE